MPIGISCLWWLITRRDLQFQVTPKSGAEERVRGRVPNILRAVGLMAAVVLYALLGLTDWVPWHVTPAAAAASGVWLVLAGIVLVLAIRRIQSPDFATSRRNAHRVPLSVAVNVNGIDGELTDISVGGAAARFPQGALSGVGHGGAGAAWTGADHDGDGAGAHRRAGRRRCLAARGGR